MTVRCEGSGYPPITTGADLCPVCDQFPGLNGDGMLLELHPQGYVN